MEMIVKEFDFPSASGLSDIYARAFSPESPDQAKGVVQICHGFADHSERYIPFVKHLVENNYIVFIHDQLGHGKSIANEEGLGYFGEKFGWHDLVNDAKLLTDFAKSLYPDLPFFIVGHSLGSLVARGYVEKHGATIDGAVFSGTSGASPATALSVFSATMVIRKNGNEYRSTLLDRLSYGSFNKRIKNAQTKFDWRTRDEVSLDEFMNDDLCGFTYTAVAYHDIFKLLQNVSSHNWYANVPFILPTFLVSGAEDPVGEYGRGVRQVYNELKKTGHNDVTMKLYADDRHDLLNELDKVQVFSDITEWLNKICETHIQNKGDN